MTILGCGSFSALLLLAGCGSSGEPVAPMLRAAAGQTRAGEEAYLTGRPKAALPALREAARLYFAAGDLPGASRALLNLALAQRAAGDTAAAAATAAKLDELTPLALQQAEERNQREVAADVAAGAAWFHALLALERGDAAGASGRLSALDEKFPAGSPWPARLANIRAEVALAGDRSAEALEQARRGQSASAAIHDRAEEARARRIAGAALIRLGQWPEARTEFLAAVHLEEALGGGERMAGDLKQLAVISDQLGDDHAAQLYARRAGAIAAAAR